MTKIRLLSDLHMEGFKYKYQFYGEDILVLAGDIITQANHHVLLSTIPSDLPIVFVAGNHEYYHSCFEEINVKLRMLEDDYPNFHFLNNENIIIKGIDFFGGTMFSDFNLYGETSNLGYMEAARIGINDFYIITKREEHYNTRRWTVQDHATHHQIFRDALNDWLNSGPNVDTKRCVVSHFVPHENAIHTRYKISKSTRTLNPYFTTDMSRYLGWEGLWLFGHTHDSSNFKCGETRLVANPKGYGNENQNSFIPDLIIDL